MSDRIYLDNAATTWPKPPQVVKEIARYYNELGVAAGRGTSAIATEVDRTIDACRHAISKLVNCQSGQVVFAFNGTDALNTALLGLISEGDEVVTTEIEHNSVLRPLNELAKSGRIKLAIASAVDGIVCLDSLTDMIGPATRICCISHASNLTGLIQPIQQLSIICKENDVMLILDAAQSVGHIDVDFDELGCDVLIGSGHKGLLGPLGTGFLCLSERAADVIRPIRLGGTGTKSESIEQPNEMPYRLESGNLNVGGIFGLLAGINFLNEKGIQSVASHEKELRSQVINSFTGNEMIVVHGAETDYRTGVLSFNFHNQQCHTVAAMLDSAFGIQARAGLHCAPLAHNSIGSEPYGGTVRISPGVFTTSNDIDFFLNAIEKLSSQLV